MADEPLNKIQKIDCSGSIFEKTTLFGDEQLFTFHRDYISDARRVIWLKQVRSESDFNVFFLFF